MTHFSIDPGLRASGVAIWEDGKLRRACLVRIPVIRDLRESWRFMATGIAANSFGQKFWGIGDRVVIEFQRTYGGRASRGDTNDLIAVAGLVGVLCGRCSHAELVLPQDWKGSTPKDVSARRTLAALEPEEVARIEPCPKSLRHNVLDAVGIGIWAFRQERAALSLGQPSSRAS